MRERAQCAMADERDDVVAATATVVRGDIGDEFLVVRARVAQVVYGVPAYGFGSVAVAVALESLGAPLGAGRQGCRVPVIHEKRRAACPIDWIGGEQ